MKEEIKRGARVSAGFVLAFIKWIVISVVTGLVGGFVGSLFHKSVELATGLRTAHGWLIYLLPIGGLVIVFLYNVTGMKNNRGTDCIIDSVRSGERPSILMAPLIFISTVITHLFGGSAGREGAALQLGGSIGMAIGRVFRLKPKDLNIIIMCGMSGVFSALFGTPLTATFFAIEVISVGQFYYAALVPCIASSLTAFGVSVLFGLEPVAFCVSTVLTVNVVNVLKTVLIAACCAVLSILFCLIMKNAHRCFGKFISNQYIRIAVGGSAIVLLTLIVGTRDYNGAGMDVISRAINGSARPWDFALKLVFTAVTLGVGFKGGEIIPTFFVGATFGCTVGGLIGIDPGLAAAIGIAATFCGVVNCPIASVFLSLELFGSGNILLMAVAVIVSFVLSGYFGIYRSQKLLYSKMTAKYINIHAR